MYILYRGDFAVFPSEDQIMGQTAQDWRALVRSRGFEPDRYCNIARVDGNEYIDFGSWSCFIVKVNIE